MESDFPSRCAVKANGGASWSAPRTSSVPDARAPGHDLCSQSRRDVIVSNCVRSEIGREQFSLQQLVPACSTLRLLSGVNKNKRKATTQWNKEQSSGSMTLRASALSAARAARMSLCISRQSRRTDSAACRKGKRFSSTSSKDPKGCRRRTYSFCSSAVPIEKALAS